MWYALNETDNYWSTINKNLNRLPTQAISVPGFRWIIVFMKNKNNKTMSSKRFASNYWYFCTYSERRVPWDSMPKNLKYYHWIPIPCNNLTVGFFCVLVIAEIFLPIIISFYFVLLPILLFLVLFVIFLFSHFATLWNETKEYCH